MKALLAVYGYKSSKEIRKCDYEKICTEAEKPSVAPVTA
jgi:hypothetical protein